MARDSGRPCGCDPASNHPCEGHATALDMSETEIDGAKAYRGGLGRVVDDPVCVVIIGPDPDGEFGFLGAGGETTWMPRFVAEDVIAELQRRLALRAGK